MLLAIVLVAAVVLGSGPASAQDQREPTPRRLLVVSVPGLNWRGVDTHELPALRDLLADAALADLAPRGVRPRSGPGDAYLTISAGARSATQSQIDGQVLALDEQSAGSEAGEIFSRRTGVTPDGGFVSLSWPALLRVNAAKPYDAVPGLLAATLEAAGHTGSVIANADGTDSIGASYERQAGLALAGEDGVVAAGQLGKELLADDPAWPFGERLDEDAVVEAFTAAWADAAGGGVVLVEASDLARALRYRSMVGAERYDVLFDRALAATDQLVGRLMAEIDPERDAVLLVAPYARSGDRDLTVVALRRPGDGPGYLRSASTQRSGFLTLVDVAPTILDTLGIPRPVDMEGRPAEVVGSSASLDARVDRLISLNAASRFRERLLVPTTTVVVLLMGLVAAAATALLAGGRAERFRPWVARIALFDLAILPASYVVRAFPLEDLGIGFYWGFVLVGAAAVATIATVAERATGRDRLALFSVLAVVAAVPAIDVMSGSTLSLSAPFGYSPTGNSRLYGISNYAYGMVAVAVCLLAGALLRGTGRRGLVRAAALLGATLLVLGVPIWGSDVGGVLAFTPSIGLFGVLALGKRVRLRTLAIGAAATIAAVLAFGFLDLSRPAGQRAHLGRLFERVGDEGLTPLFDLMERKLLANLNVSTSSFWVAAVPIALLFWLFVVRFPTRPVERLRAQVPGIGPGFAAAVAAALLGSMVNDSGAIVGGVAATVMVCSVVHLLVRPDPDIGEPSA
ncbi:MAG: hypothetical protein M3Z03_05615 [Actinomycetota bacterium]|nr:hypothetical protein [Actinomycetota bacterium]